MSGRSPLDDWKHQAGGRPRPGRPAQAGSNRKKKLVIALVPLLVAVGTVLAWPFLIREKPVPTFRSIVIDEYRDWPINAWARHDGESLKAILGGDVALDRQQDKRMILEAVRALEVKNSQSPMVIHLCAFGVVRDKKVYVVPAKARAGEVGDWLPLAELLQEVEDRKGNRLLLLDLRPVADVRFGQQGDELPTALHDELKTFMQDRKFFVLAQSAPARYPYVSPELQHGAFGEFLARGLNGQADAWNDGQNEDDQVTVTELASYVRAQVVAWQTHHKVPVCPPVLYGPTTDFTLVAAVSRNEPLATPQKAEEPADAAPVPDWAVLDQWRAQDAHVRTPWAYRALEEAAIRAEQRLQGGMAPDRVREAWKEALAEADKARQAGPPALKLPPTVGRIARPRKRVDVSERIESLLTLIKAPTAKGDDISARAGALVEPKEKDKEPASTPDPNPYILALVEDLIKRPELPSTVEVAAYQNALKGFKLKRKPIEVGLIDFFADPNITAERKFWPRSAAQTALAAALRGEEVIPADSRAMDMPAIRKPVEEADQKFQAAILGFLENNEDVWKAKVAALEEIVNVYRSSKELTQNLEEAWAEWDRALALLVTLAEYAPEGPTPDSSGWDIEWDNLYREVTELTGYLADVNPRADRLASSTPRVIRTMQDLMAKALPTSSALNQMGPVELRGRLRLPLWKAGDRKELLRTGRDKADGLAVAFSAAKAAKPAEARELPKGERPFRAGADSRTQRMKQLIELAGGRQDELTSPDQLRAYLANGLVDRFQKPETPLAERARLAWIVRPGDCRPGADGSRPADPIPAARAEADGRLTQWLANQRYRPLADKLKANKADAAQALADVYGVAAQHVLTPP